VDLSITGGFIDRVIYIIIKLHCYYYYYYYYYTYLLPDLRR